MTPRRAPLNYCPAHLISQRAHEQQHGMIEMFHVSKAYNGREALHDVNLKIDKGEFIILTGRSGAGKTTLLRLIFRAEVPDSGQILVNDRNVAQFTESRIPY